MHDHQNKAGIWLIDFAKTLRIEDHTLTHRQPWVVGNHEDGYLVGLDNLVQVEAIAAFHTKSPQTGLL